VATHDHTPMVAQQLFVFYVLSSLRLLYFFQYIVFTFVDISQVTGCTDRLRNDLN